MNNIHIALSGFSSHHSYQGIEGDKKMKENQKLNKLKQVFSSKTTTGKSCPKNIRNQPKIDPIIAFIQKKKLRELDDNDTPPWSY